MPRPDGVFLTDDLQRLVQQGKVANVPVLSGVLIPFDEYCDQYSSCICKGDCDDEGTLFSLAQRNIT